MYIMMSYCTFSFWDGDMDGWMDDCIYYSTTTTLLVVAVHACIEKKV